MVSAWIPLRRSNQCCQIPSSKHPGKYRFNPAETCSNILDGTVIGRNMQHHRHQEFIRFLNAIEEQVPGGKVIHAIVDNYATHKHPKVRQWLARHPRWTFHFTPTSASWLNAVEGFFAKLTRQRLKRGVFRSVVDLQFAINCFVADTNADPKPFVWTADPKRVLAAVKRGKQTLEVSPLAMFEDVPEELTRVMRDMRPGGNDVSDVFEPDGGAHVLRT